MAVSPIKSLMFTYTPFGLDKPAYIWNAYRYPNHLYAKELRIPYICFGLQ